MKHLSLFTGIGGFDLGFARCGIKTVAMCEQDKYCQSVLRKHWIDIEIHDDVTTLDGEEYRGTIDIISGGDPCQANSAASSIGKSTALAFGGDFIRIVSEVLPTWVVRENPTKVRRDAPWPAERFAACLEELGYSAVLLDMQCAALTGVRRERTFVVGSDPSRISSFLDYVPIGEGTAWNIAQNVTPRAVLNALTCNPKRYDTRDNYIVQANGRMRVPDTTERLRCQGFPDDWLPDGISFTRAAKMAGNAMPVQIAEWLGIRIMEAEPRKCQKR